MLFRSGLGAIAIEEVDGWIVGGGSGKRTDDGRLEEDGGVI